jgi:hypothetical protein
MQECAGVIIISIFLLLLSLPPNNLGLALLFPLNYNQINLVLRYLIIFRLASALTPW